MRNGLLDFEARRIARTVCSYGVLERKRIYELTEASTWHAASFDRACELAIQRGLIRDLGLGYYASPARPRQPPLGKRVRWRRRKGER